jgi:uncharacterized short protein YbdD (DUF466 family)
MAISRKTIKISIDVLRRFQIYCDDYEDDRFNRELDYTVETEKEFIRECLGRKYNRDMRMLDFTKRKKMLLVVVKLEFLQAMSRYINHFMHHCSYLEEYKLAVEDDMRVQRWIRMFDRRNRARRKVFKLNIKDVMLNIEDNDRPVKVAA